MACSGRSGGEKRPGKEFRLRLALDAGTVAVETGDAVQDPRSSLNMEIISKSNVMD